MVDGMKLFILIIGRFHGYGLFCMFHGCDIVAQTPVGVGTQIIPVCRAVAHAVEYIEGLFIMAAVNVIGCCLQMRVCGIVGGIISLTGAGAVLLATVSTIAAIASETAKSAETTEPVIVIGLILTAILAIAGLAISILALIAVSAITTAAAGSVIAAVG